MNDRRTLQQVATTSLAEGDSLQRKITFDDLDSSAWTVTTDYGDGNQEQSIIGTTEFDIDHVYADDGVYTVSVTVDDGDGGQTIETFTVTVDNVAPVVSLSGPSNVDEGSTYIGSGSFIDPGADTWTATVDYGDGTGSQTLTLNANKTLHAGSRLRRQRHLYDHSRSHRR